MPTLRLRIRRATDSLFQLLYPGEDHLRDAPAAQREVRAMSAALIAAIAAAIVGLIVFYGDVPLWGPVSPGTLGMLLAALTAMTAAAIEHTRFPLPSLPGSSPMSARIQRVVNVVSISLVHGGIALLVVGLTNAVLVRGFTGLKLDVFTSTMIVTILCAVTAYATTLSAGDITTTRLSTLLAVFMTGGVVVAMLTTSDAQWWKLHFSELGVGTDLSGKIFNATLIVSGLLLASLATLMAPALETWAEGAPPSRTRNIRVVGWSFVAIGACLAGVGTVPVNVSVLVHNSFATGMAVVFGVLLIGLRWLLDGFSRTFLLFSDVCLIGIAVSAILFWPVQYYNLAAFELVAAGIIFGWLIIFLRHIDASTRTRVSG
ncbi:DUF998 domain-containing protein [Leucobacter viscericola]|uniref:DUF998 domain-containing protein n=1 Tax=Leucobacter viscericola TaxID=2714935 RepID=A0A6G7XI91_9MICO|nr:DUF998 domain-containing protein [Leucobacter viscericola]QIK64334.1 DUF998 domain-containing protein [Leucobacter viscericola]